MAGRNNIRVLVAASEFEPLTNIGHLGRVVPNLSVALHNIAKSADAGARTGNIDVRVVLPKYAGIPRRYLDAAKPICEFAATLGRRTYPCAVFKMIYRCVIVYLVSCGDYFERTYVYSSVAEDVERYSCFCNAVLAMLNRIDFVPDVIQCHDWHMSYIPTLYKTNRNRRASDVNIKTLFVIHSMQYQGICSRYDMLDLLDLSSEYFTSSTLEFYGQANSFKGGLLFSDRLATVSPNYAREIQHAYYGENLEGIIRARSADISGIMCGLDPTIYNPATDERIYMNYDAESVGERKPANKKRLQELLGFEQDQDIPVIIIISDELDYDKGIDLIKFVFDDITSLGVQLIIAGKGKSDYHDFFIAKQIEHKGKVAYIPYYGGVFWDGAKWSGWEELIDEPSVDTSLTETMLISGSDMLLRPSRIEPCGEKHLIALKYGTLPIVRETGGLKDVVNSYNSDTGEGNGFSFSNYNAHDMLFTINRAVDVYRNDQSAWRGLIKTAMQVNQTWEAAAIEYLDIYKSLSEAR